MQRVTGLTDPQLVDYELHAELAITEALQKVADTIADRIGAIQVAAGIVRVRWDGCPYGLHPAHAGPCALVAADEVPDDGLPPGQPYVSPDDLSAIPPLWQEAVAQTVLPVVAEVWRASSGAVYTQMVDATNITALPSVGSLAAEQYLAQAANTFEEVGDELWATARTQLLEGFEKGESIPELAARVRGSAGLTAKTAVLVARTQVLDASNDGSIATARASGIDMQKEWMSAEDARVRPTHVAANGQKVDLNAKFTVGGYECDRPHDPTLPPALRYSCRCTTGYLIPEKAVKQAVRDAEPEPTLPNTSGVEEVGEIPTGITPALPGPTTPGGVPSLPAVGVEVRPALAAARTTGAVERVFTEEFERITGRRPQTVSFAGSAATAREHAEGLLRGLERFPDAKLTNVSAARLAQDSTEYAHAVGGRVGFNYHWASPAGRKKYLTAVRSDVDSRWHPTGTDSPVAIALHEFGHILDIATVGKAIRQDLDSLLTRRAALRDADLAARKAAGELADPDDFVAGTGVEGLINREISRYATKNREELVAEAFADVMVNGEGASLLSREIFDLLEAEYRRSGGVVRPAVAREVLPSVPRPVGLAGQTVAQLRALAKERGVTVPAGAKKADIVRLLDETSTPATFEVRAAAARTGDDALAAAAPKQLTKAQAEALDDYGLESSFTINAALRSSGGDLTKLTRERHPAIVAEVDSAMRPLPAEITVFRRADVRHIFAPDSGWFDDLPKDLTGRTFVDHGFVSTYVETPRVRGSMVMRIVAPEGTPAISGGGLEARELVLGRGLTFRVVADHGTPGGTVRMLDVEIVPATRTADVPLAKRPVAALRALAKERGLTIPPKSTKPDIVRILEAPPLTPAQILAAERKALREATRVKFAQVQQATGTSRLLAEVDYLLSVKAETRVIRENLDEALIGPEQLFANADPAVLVVLRGVVDDPAKLRAAVTRLSTKAKIKPVSRAGAKVKFDPDAMEPVGADITTGTQVTVIRRGASVTLPDGTVVQLTKARVTPVVKVAPVKRVPKQAATSRSAGRAKPSAGVVKGRDVAGDEDLIRRAFEAGKHEGEWSGRGGRWLADEGGYQAHLTIARELGFDGLPKVVREAEFGRLQGGKGTELYRGWGWGTKEKGTDLAEQYIRGRLHVGGGHGLGTNMSNELDIAMYYASEDRFTRIPDSAVMAFILRADARVASYPKILAERDAFLAGLPDGPYADAARAVFDDVGTFAMARGYDAMVVREGESVLLKSKRGVEEWVIFNRTKLVALDELF